MKKYVQKEPLRSILGLVFVLSLFLEAFTYIGFAQAEETVRVQVTIDHVWTLIEKCDWGLINTACDFYAKIKVDEQEWKTGKIDNDNDIYPEDWRFTSEEIPISKGSVPVSIELYDSDTGDDDHIDIVHGDAEDGKDLHLTVALVPCSISSNALIHEYPNEDFDDDRYTGACNTLLYTESYSGGRTGLIFKVEVLEPSYANNLGVRCLHDPIWPQQGQTVTISAEALTSQNGVLKPRISDTIEIWVNDNTGPYHVSSGTNTSVTVGPLNEDSFTYNCRVIDDGMVRSTGWRIVAVGSDIADEYEDTVPVYYSGGRKDSLDLLFHPETNSYNGPTDKSFLHDIYDMIRNAFLSEEVFLENQMNFNFWIAKDSIALQKDENDRCGGQPGKQRAWSDENAVVHKLDCWDHNFQSTWGSFTTMKHDAFRVMLHESCHALFSLSDEYECTGNCTTFFRENWPFPNAYKSEDYCRNDAQDYPYDWGSGVCEQNALKLERDPDLCRGFLAADGKTWWTSDPASDDIMVDEGRIRKLDRRRIEWIFCICRNGGC